MMTSPSHFSRHRRNLTATDRETQSGLVRRHGGLIKIPGNLGPPPVAREGTRRLTKLLLNVNIEGSLGPVQVVMSPENAVGDLVKAAVEIYVREKRRPLLHEANNLRFDLHYSQFSLESLKTEEKLINLGSRNFYLCRKPIEVATSSNCDELAHSLKLMEILL